VGAVLIAVLIGPGAACIAVSTALIIQALFFGDGGITALGANCLNIAVVMPWTGYWTYRLVSRGAPASSRRVLVAAGVGGYVGLNASALTTALMFGLQPILHHTAQGRPIYCPYPLSIAVPAMAVEHLLIFGFAEAAVTALVIKYLQHADLAFLAGARGEAVTESKDSCGVSQPPVEEGAHA
jgi:cobalt/nickel transport system permease protein